jgi:hypothetical protein
MDRNAWIATVGSLAFSALAHAAPFAMITDVKGDAWAVEGGKPRKLALLSYIENPVEVKVDATTKLGITYFANGVQYSFDGPARVALDAKAPRVIEGKAADSKKVGPEKAISGGLSNDQWRRLQQATVVMRTVKPSFTVVGPDKTALLTREPEFEWTPAADAKRYRVVIYGSDNQILHEATTDGTALQPGAAVKLEAGKNYRWKVDALGVAKPVSTSGTFSIAEDAVRQRISAGRPGAGAELAPRLFYATTLEAEGYMHDARAEWKALSKEFPNVPEIKQRGM